MLRLCIIATLFTIITISCKKSKTPSPQYEVPTEQISNLITENDSDSPVLEINLDENYKSLLSDSFVGKNLFIINKLNVDDQFKTLKERITFTYKPSNDAAIYSENFTKFQESLNKNIQLVEGVIVASGKNPNDPSYEPGRLEFSVSLIKYTNPEDGVSSYYGAIELGNNQLLLIYGNIIQVTIFNKVTVSDTNLKNFNYQSIFTEDYNLAYQGHGLQIILGSYMAQRLLFRKNFNINLELNELIYQGPEHSIADSEFEGKSDKDKNTYFMSKVHSWSSDNINGFSNKTFSMLYTNHPKLSQIVGQTLGMAYINQTCKIKYKALWVKPYLNGEKQGQYLVDAHEISHMLGAYHNNDDNILMNANLNIYNTYFDYTKIGNIDSIFASKDLVTYTGSCSNQRLKNIKSKKVVLPQTISTPELCDVQH